jgi:hypothetical protein
LISLAVGGDLDDRRAERLERHLESCAACRLFADELRTSLDALQRLDSEATPSPAIGSVRGEVLTGLRTRRSSFAWMPAGQHLAAIGAIAVMLVVAAVLVRQGGDPPRPSVAERMAPPSIPTAPPERVPSPTAQPRINDSVEAEAPTASPAIHNPPLRIARADRPSTDLDIKPRRSASIEPMTVKILTSDPDVVIYWIVDPKGAEKDA